MLRYAQHDIFEYFTASMWQGKNMLEEVSPLLNAYAAAILTSSTSDS
jgi:hypothetical protein